MKRTAIRILLILFGLTQLMAPLVHAHAESGIGGTGLHAHLPQVSETAPSSVATALPPQLLVVELKAGIFSEEKEFTDDASDFALLADLLVTPVDQSRALRISWPPVSLPKSVLRHPQSGPRASPVI